MYLAIEEHGLRLFDIFPLASPMDRSCLGGVKLCKKLHRIETREHTRAEDICNGDIDPSEDTAYDERVLDRLDSLLSFRASNVPVFINSDPRGYALKIKSEWMHEHAILTIQRDMGGYGILAPDFS